MVVGITPLATLEVDVSDWPLRKVTLNVVAIVDCRRTTNRVPQASRGKRLMFPPTMQSQFNIG